MKLKLNNKGLSLPLTIGLLLLLVTITATMNELVIRALRASHQIEASDKAYFAAEAGVEDALYELSLHTAGYETAVLGDPNVRTDEFAVSPVWQNQWEIDNRGLNNCSSVWEDSFVPTFCGRMYQGDKLVINLFSDDADTTGVPVGGVNEDTAIVSTLDVSEINIKFRVPKSVVDQNPNAFDDGLLIDNDGDLGVATATATSGPEGILGLNEDGGSDFGYANSTCYFSGTVNVDDNDCDGLEDEDSKEDPVVLWKLVDNTGRTFQPLRGCKNDPIHSSHPGDANATICEKNFSLPVNGYEVSALLSDQDKGFDDGDDTIKTLETFLTDYTAGDTKSLQMEILVAAPLAAVNQDNESKIPLPYLEYGIEYSATNASSLPVELPSTFFAIKSDGYYQDFKQSITTNVVPRATTRLLDLTIIQQ